MQRVVDLRAKDHVVADARNAVVNEPPSGRAGSSVTDECRRLAELLRLDAVGVVTSAGGRRRVAWWAAPGSPPLPARLDDIVDGREQGWIVCPLPEDASVFARTTSETPARAATVLAVVGPSLASGATGPVLDLRDDPPPSAPPADESARALPPVEGLEALRGALGDLRDAMEFESATLWLPAGIRAWAVAAMVGPQRPWHAVLDPAAMGAVGEGVVHADARTLPGIGGRLAALGCGAVAELPLSGGGRVILDAASVRRRTPGLDHLAPYLEQISSLADGFHAPGDTELRTVETAAGAVRTVLRDPDANLDALLDAVRGSLGADELFHVTERSGDLTVAASPAGWPRRIPREVQADLRSMPEDDDASARQMGVILGASSAHLRAAFAREDAPTEALVAGWRGAPGISSAGLRAILQLLGAARGVVESHRHTVDVLMTKERNRWAYEIHDGLTQAVTTAVLELEALGRRIRHDPEEAVQMLAATRAEIRKALSELRGMLYELSQDEKAASASQAMDEPLTKYVNDVVKRWRLPAKVTVKGDLRDMPKPLLGAAYVVIREALANSAKHAGARSVNVSIQATNQELTVEVGDTGRGFSADAGNGNGPRRHFGLEMIRKRVAEVGGTLDVSSSPGRGTRVVAHLPVGEGER
jgi:signal transduction histidine kinase